MTSKRQDRWYLIIPAVSPAFQIVSHELSLDEAVHGYDQFDKRADGWTKSSSTRYRARRDGGQPTALLRCAPDGLLGPAAACSSDRAGLRLPGFECVFRWQ